MVGSCTIHDIRHKLALAPLWAQHAILKGSWLDAFAMCSVTRGLRVLLISNRNSTVEGYYAHPSSGYITTIRPGTPISGGFHRIVVDMDTVPISVTQFVTMYATRLMHPDTLKDSYERIETW